MTCKEQIVSVANISNVKKQTNKNNQFIMLLKKSLLVITGIQILCQSNQILAW